MASLVYWINQLSGALFAALVWPLRGLSPWIPLAVVSLASGLLMLWIFGRCSDQERIRRLRQKMRAHLLGVRLYQHNIGTVARFQGRIVTDTARYLQASLFPLLVMTVPVLLILAQLNLYFASRPLAVDEAAILTASFSEETDINEALLEAGPGVKIETPGVRDPQRRQVTWRIRALSAGRHEVVLRAGNMSASKVVVVGSDWGPVPAFRSASTLDLLLYPGEAPLPSGLKLIEVGLPSRTIPVLSDWLLFFLVVSMVTAFAFHRPLGVEI